MFKSWSGLGLPMFRAHASNYSPPPSLFERQEGSSGQVQAPRPIYWQTRRDWPRTIAGGLVREPGAFCWRTSRPRGAGKEGNANVITLSPSGLPIFLSRLRKVSRQSAFPPE